MISRHCRRRHADCHYAFITPFIFIILRQPHFLLSDDAITP
jgi:hypothetical protein